MLSNPQKNAPWITSNSQIVRWLDNGGDANTRDGSGSLLLEFPGLDRPTAEKLILHGAHLDPVKAGLSEHPIDFLKHKTDPDTITFLAAKGCNPSIPAPPDERSGGALAQAARKGSIQVVRALLKAGSQPDLPGHFDETPLSETDRMSVAKLLIRKGANPNALDNHGHPAWLHAHHRIEQRKPGETKNNLIWFLDHGASLFIRVPFRRTTSEKTPLWALLNPSEAQIFLEHPCSTDRSKWLDPGAIDEIKDPETKGLFQTCLIKHMTQAISTEKYGTQQPSDGGKTRAAIPDPLNAKKRPDPNLRSRWLESDLPKIPMSHTEPARTGPPDPKTRQPHG